MPETPTLIRYSFPFPDKVEAFSTTRHSPFGLTSQEILDMGNYAAFNVTHYCGDSLKRVARNRQWLCDELHIASEALILPRQTHTNHTQAVTSHILTLSDEEREILLDETDALVTNSPGLCIGVSTADCIPILLYDPAHHACAAIHAGWRGTVSRIPQETVKMMEQLYHSVPPELYAVIGPGISAEAYEVGEDVVGRFEEAGFDMRGIVRRPKPSPLSPPAEKLRPHLDLRAANCLLLEEIGIPLEQISVADICTYTQSDDFFSARKLGIQSGRIFTGILLH